MPDYIVALFTGILLFYFIGQNTNYNIWNEINQLLEILYAKIINIKNYRTYFINRISH